MATTINCSFKDAVGNPLDGYILVGVDSWLMKDDNASSFTTLIGKVTFTAGACTLNLEPSELQQVTYSFEVYHYKSVTTSDPETGEPIVTIVDEPLLPKFYARVPISLTPISFNQLAKQSGINRDNIDTALSAITRRLYNEDTFWSRLQEEVFVPRGVYSATAWYSRGDIVTWEYGSYLYYYSDRAQGVIPSTATHWQQIGFRGATGAGTTGNDSPFGVGWDGQTDAPSRNAVYDALQQYALASTVNGLAPLASPALTGNPTAPTQTSSDNSAKIATTAFVQTLIATVTKAIVPVGLIAPYVGTSAPTGWVLCDGRQLSQTTYSALYAIIGTSHNTGGETTGFFRVPDMRGRVVAALDNMGGTAASRLTAITSILGANGGTESVTLTSAQIPAHTHAINTLPGGNAAGAASGQLSSVGNASTSQYVVTGTNTAANTGGGGSHSNIQPTIFENYIIYSGL